MMEPNNWDELLAMEPPVPEVWSGDGQIRSDEEMETLAKRMKCRLEKADDSTLFIDIDSIHSLAIFWENLKLADEKWGVIRSSVAITPSKSGGANKHIRVKLLRPLPLIYRILLQACLGSDLKRELISGYREKAGMLESKPENVVVFFEPDSSC